MSESGPKPRTSYDEVPYASFPFPQTHPDRMATLARLMGLTAPAVEHCRVLELGCAAGGNLIPLAVALPEAQFVGVDLSAVQIAEGTAAIDALGLRNVCLLPMSISDVGAELGRFDYIICHGVYSWVPDTVQEHILATCARQLADDGIAYVSYNTLPGWRMRGMIRDLMRYHATAFADPAQRVGQARAILDFLAKWVPTDRNAYGMLLKSETEALRSQPDYYILHEHLEDTNAPLYFHEFAARAARHGLQYLAEAEFGTMLASNFPPEVGDTVRRIAPDVIRQEQFMDFLRNRSFRQTLLVRDGRPIERAVAPERVTPLWVASRLRAVSAEPELAGEAEEAFRAPDGGLLKTPNAVTKAAMVVLARHWPAALPFTGLLEQALAVLAPYGQPAAPDGLGADAALASDLLQCYGAGLVELHAGSSRFVTRPGSRPLASALARMQAARGLTQVTNFRHEIIEIDRNIARLLPLLDGTRTRDALVRQAAGWALASPDARGKPTAALLAAAHAMVERTLAGLAGAALLSA